MALPSGSCSDAAAPLAAADAFVLGTTLRSPLVERRPPLSRCEARGDEAEHDCCDDLGYRRYG
jgi:hypothetical protein